MNDETRSSLAKRLKLSSWMSLASNFGGKYSGRLAPGEVRPTPMQPVDWLNKPLPPLPSVESNKRRPLMAEEKVGPKVLLRSAEAKGLISPDRVNGFDVNEAVTAAKNRLAAWNKLNGLTSHGTGQRSETQQRAVANTSHFSLRSDISSSAGSISSDQSSIWSLSNVGKSSPDIGTLASHFSVDSDISTSANSDFTGRTSVHDGNTLPQQDAETRRSRRSGGIYSSLGPDRDEQTTFQTDRKVTTSPDNARLIEGPTMAEAKKFTKAGKAKLIDLSHPGQRPPGPEGHLERQTGDLPAAVKPMNDASVNERTVSRKRTTNEGDDKARQSRAELERGPEGFSRG